jgi:ABC-2 type transport system ATP-binding protein
MTTTAAPSALSVTGLRKSFGEKTVLDGIDLDVAEGTTVSSSAPTAAARPPQSRSSRHCLPSAPGGFHR